MTNLFTISLLPFYGFNLIFNVQPVIETGIVAPQIEENPPIVRVYATDDYDFDRCSCVSGAKHLTGTPQSEYWGNANEIKANSNEPKVGDLMLLNEGLIGHVAVIINTTEDHTTIEEWNGEIPCGKSIRQIPLDYPLIRGFRDLDMIE